MNTLEMAAEFRVHGQMSHVKIMVEMASLEVHGVMFVLENMAYLSSLSFMSSLSKSFTTILPETDSYLTHEPLIVECKTTTLDTLAEVVSL